MDQYLLVFDFVNLFDISYLIHQHLSQMLFWLWYLQRARAALKDDALQAAFDELWPTWSSEMAAMIYADILQVMDLILLTSIVDNRRAIERIKQELS